MKSSDRYERAKQANAERLREEMRRTDLLATTRAARVQAEKQQRATRRRREAQNLQRLVNEVLQALDQKNFPGISTVRIGRKGFLGYRGVGEPGWHLVGLDFTYTIRSDELTATRQYYLLADATFAVATEGYVNQTHSGPPKPIYADVIPFSTIVNDKNVHTAILRALQNLGGSSAIF